MPLQTPAMIDTPRVLVFGASGQIGAALLAALSAAGTGVLAVSRHQQSSRPGLQWLRGDLAQAAGLPDRIEAIASCGPLDAFADWLARGEVGCSRVVAFGSTSVVAKRASADPEEHALVARLARAESILADTADIRGIACTVLRPTLVYGAGRDRTLSRIAAIAARTRVFPLPRDARGLRQPVHVDDLADAALAALARPHGAPRILDLPGGETLPYDDMVERTLAALQPVPRLLRLPAPLFAAAAVAAGLAGLRGFGAAARARMREDLVFDAAPARAALGYAPRGFAPTQSMLRPAGATAGDR